LRTFIIPVLLVLVMKFKKIACIELEVTVIWYLTDEHPLCWIILWFLVLNTVHAAVELDIIYGDPQENNYWSLHRLHAINVQLITFISRLNALDYTKLRSWNLRCIKFLKILKDIELKITPKCFGSYAIHHQGL